MFHCLKEILVWGEEKNKSQKWILKYDETASEVMEWMMRELFLKIIDLKYFLFSNIPLYMLCWINISSIWLKTISSSGRTTHHYQDMIRKHYKLYFIEFHHSPELTPGHFQDWIYMSWIMEIFHSLLHELFQEHYILLVSVSKKTIWATDNKETNLFVPRNAQTERVVKYF